MLILSNIMSDEIETKLAAARTRLILDKPFLGALVLRLPMEEASPGWCKSVATDAKKFYYNRNYINEISLEQTQFILAHEALHCALSHFSRRQHRIKHRWDLACDLAINPILINDGLKPTPDALYDSQFDGMTAEEIYPTIDDLDDRETEDQHVYDNEQQSQQNNDNRGDKGEGGNGDKDEQQQGSGAEQQTDKESGQPDDSPGTQLDEQSGGSASQPPPLTEDEKEALSVQWQQRMAGAAQQAMQAGKMGESLRRLIDHLLQPQLPWRMLLARYMTAIARDDYSFQRPSRREGSAILPSLRSTQIDVVIVLDTSGSIGQGEIEEFVSEVDAIKGQMRARITLLACDEKIHPDCPWTFEPWDTFDVPDDLTGGGGTDFRPAFDYVQQLGKEPDLLVYFTDAEGTFPEREVHFPVIWLVKGRAEIPWGQRVQLN